VLISDAPGNTIGGATAGARNVISGNKQSGVDIRNGAPGNTIGGTATGARNVISGNKQSGVDIQPSGAAGNLVQGNYIGD